MHTKKTLATLLVGLVLAARTQTQIRQDSSYSSLGFVEYPTSTPSSETIGSLLDDVNAPSSRYAVLATDAGDVAHVTDTNAVAHTTATNAVAHTTATNAVAHTTATSASFSGSATTSVDASTDPEEEQPSLFKRLAYTGVSSILFMVKLPFRALGFLVRSSRAIDQFVYRPLASIAWLPFMLAKMAFGFLVASVILMTLGSLSLTSVLTSYLLTPLLAPLSSPLVGTAPLTSLLAPISSFLVIALTLTATACFLVMISYLSSAACFLADMGRTIVNAIIHFSVSSLHLVQSTFRLLVNVPGAIVRGAISLAMLPFRLATAVFGMLVSKVCAVRERCFPDPAIDITATADEVAVTPVTPVATSQVATIGSVITTTIAVASFAVATIAAVAATQGSPSVTYM